MIGAFVARRQDRRPASAGPTGRRPSAPAALDTERPEPESEAHAGHECRDALHSRAISSDDVSCEVRGACVGGPPGRRADSAAARARDPSMAKADARVGLPRSRRAAARPFARTDRAGASMRRVGAWPARSGCRRPPRSPGACECGLAAHHSEDASSAVVMIEPAADWRVIGPVALGSPRSRASPVLIVPALLGSAHHHHDLFDLALTAFAPAVCGAPSPKRDADPAHRPPGETSAPCWRPPAPEGCGGRRRLLAVAASLHVFRRSTRCASRADDHTWRSVRRSRCQGRDRRSGATPTQRRALWQARRGRLPAARPAPRSAPRPRSRRCCCSTITTRPRVASRPHTNPATVPAPRPR